MPKLEVFTPGGFSSGGQIDVNAPLREAQIKVQGIQAGTRALAQVGEAVGTAIRAKQNRQWLMERDSADSQLHLDSQDFDKHWLSNDRFDAEELEQAGVEGVQLTQTVGGEEVSRGQIPTSEFLPDFRFKKINQRVDELAEGITNTTLREEWVTKQKGRLAERFTNDTIQSARVQREQRQSMLEERFTVAEQNEDFGYMRDLTETMELTQEERTTRMNEIDVAEEISSIDKMLLNGSDSQKRALESQLRDTEIASFLTTKERLQKANQLKASIQSGRAKRDKLDEMSLKQRIKEREAGTNNGLSEAEVNFEDPAKQEQFKRAVRVANEVGDDANTFFLKSREEQDADIEALVQQIQEPGNFFEENAILQGKLKARTQFARNYAKDPVQTLTSVNPEIAQQQKQLLEMEEAARNGTADPALVQQARISYNETLIASQERMGTGRNDAVLLSENQVAAISSTFSNATGENKLLALNGMQARYGDYWPMVSKQLQKEKVLTGTDRIVSAQDIFLDGMVSETVYRAQANGGAKGLYERQGVAGAQKSTYKDSIRSALEKFDNTLVAGQDSSQLYEELFDTVEMTGLQMVQEGNATLSNAAEKAAQALAYSKYHEIDASDNYHKYRMPANRGTFTGGVDNPDLIRSQLEAIRRNPTKFDYDPPVSRQGFQDITAEQAAESRRKRSYWVNDPNDTGVVLMDEDMSPVLKDGRWVHLTWDEIATMPAVVSPLASQTRRRGGSQTAQDRATAQGGR